MLTNRIQYQPQTFIFTLLKESVTSAGVYVSSGEDEVLVRTLWSNKQYGSGPHQEVWDHMDDQGMPLANGDYTIKVQSNNIEYIYDAVIGNTSTKNYDEVHQGSNRCFDMCFTSQRGYYCHGYSEGRSSQSYFELDDIQIKFSPTKYDESGQSSYYCDTDGINVYWMGWVFTPGDDGRWFIFATKTIDNAEVIFSSGTTPFLTRWGRTYASAIDTGKVSQNLIFYSLKVQQSGEFLFAVFKNNLDEVNNEVFVYDKITGALITSAIIPYASKLALDSDDNIWICGLDGTQNKIIKYIVGIDGALTISSEFILLAFKPYAIDINTDSTIVKVADHRQQIYTYNLVTGILMDTFGVLDGYTISPEVTNEKFNFKVVHNGIDSTGTFIRQMTDGSFWIGDGGNWRMQHYDLDNVFVERIMYLPAFYDTSIDANNPQRLFATFLEFEIDYINNVWELKRNYGFEVDDKYKLGSLQIKIFRPATLSNNRCYAMFYNLETSDFELVELQSTGVRYTGIHIPLYSEINKSGDLKRYVQYPTAPINQPIEIFIKRLSGFDIYNNPIWDSEEIFVSTPPAFSLIDAFNDGNITTLNLSNITTTGVNVLYNAGAITYSPGGVVPATGYHLEGFKNNVWLWKTSPGTRQTYGGEFPTDGAFDIGNGTNYAGNISFVIENHIFWGHHGEFWQQGQTNKTQHYSDIGLMLGQFGEVNGIYDSHTMRYKPNAYSYPGMAGNVLSPCVTKYGKEIYIYQNDESYHSGVNRWKITGLDSIEIQNIPVCLNNANGLTIEYFNSPDLNSAYKVLIDKVKTIDINLSNILLQTTNVSVRFKGILIPVHTGSTTFKINTSGKARLWINETLVINGWSNVGVNLLTGTIDLTEQVMCWIKMEYSGQKGDQIKITWTSGDFFEEIIPEESLVPSYKLNGTNQKTNLLEGFWYDQLLQNNLYGWAYSPEFEPAWSISTSRTSYQKEGIQSLNVLCEGGSALRTLIRDMGNTENLQSWTFSGKQNFARGGFSAGTTRRNYYQILDEQEKVIVNFQFLVDGEIVDGHFYMNTVPYAPYWFEDKTINLMNKEFSVTVKNGIVAFMIDGFGLFTDTVYDPEANWRNPKYFRFYRGDEGDFNMEISSLYFSPVAKNILG